MDSYQKDLYDTLLFIRKFIHSFSSSQKREIKDKIASYLSFRDQVDHFLTTHFIDICTLSCYENKLSACCSRDGIIIFFADLTINFLMSDSNETEQLLSAIKNSKEGFKCIFLGKEGCLWKIKPIVCQMFLCDRAQNLIFKGDPEIYQTWNMLLKRKKEYTWPDHPVLFDELEELFIKAGYESSLMYFHLSPGLIRLKQSALASSKSNHFDSEQ